MGDGDQGPSPVEDGVTGRRSPDHAVDLVVHDDRWESADFDMALAVRAARAALSDVLPAAARGAEVAIVLAGDAECRELNRRWRGKDAPTNVLSFPDDAPHPSAGGARPLGDVVLAFDTILGEARDAGRTLEEHAAHLVVHGVLHLLGFDHQTVAEADAMEGRETMILASLGISDPYTTDEEHSPAATARVLP